MKDYLRHMVLFRVLVDCGSITAAAEQQGLSKSVLSQHLKSLEQALGVKLLHRTTRKQSLTPAGRDFYHACCAIEEQAEQAWEHVQATGFELSGSIRITAPFALMNTVVAPAMAQLVTAYPQISLQLLSDDVQVNLIDNQIDLAIRVGKMADSSLLQRRIGGFQEMLVAGADSAWQPCDPETPYIANIWESSRIAHVFQSADGDEQTLGFRSKARVSNLETVLTLVRARMGVACIPAFVGDTAAGLRDCLPGYRKPAVGVYAVQAYKADSIPALVRESTRVIESQLALLTAEQLG